LPRAAALLGFTVGTFSGEAAAAMQRRTSIAPLPTPTPLLLPDLLRYHLAENVLCVEAQKQSVLNRCSWAQELIDEHGADNVLYVNLCGNLPADTRSVLSDNVVDCNMTDGYCHSLEELLLLSATVQSWLDASPTNVVTILYTFDQYSVASIVVSCILKFSGMYGSPSMAYTYVTEKRTATLHQRIEHMALHCDADTSSSHSSTAAIHAAAAAAPPKRRHSIFGLVELPSSQAVFGSLFSKKEAAPAPPPPPPETAEPPPPRGRRSSLAQFADGVKDIFGLSRPKERMDDRVARSKMAVSQNDSKYMPSLKRCLGNFGTMLELCGFMNEHPLQLSHIVMCVLPFLRCIFVTFCACTAYQTSTGRAGFAPFSAFGSGMPTMRIWICRARARHTCARACCGTAAFAACTTTRWCTTTAAAATTSSCCPWR